MFMNLPMPLIIPGAPWQKCTNFILCDPAEVAKFPLMKCLIKNKIDLDIMRQYTDKASIGN
jgi:hypothetical protein